MSKAGTESVAVRLPATYRALLGRFACKTRRAPSAAISFLCAKGIKHLSRSREVSSTPAAVAQ